MKKINSIKGEEATAKDRDKRLQREEAILADLQGKQLILQRGTEKMRKLLPASSGEGGGGVDKSGTGAESDTGADSEDSVGGAGAADAVDDTGASEVSDKNKSADKGDMFDDGEPEVHPDQAQEEEKEVSAGAAWHRALEEKRRREAPSMSMAEFMAMRTGVKDNTWTGYQLAFRGWAEFFSGWIKLTNEERAKQKPAVPPLPTCADPSSVGARSRSAEPPPDWRKYDVTIQAAVRLRWQCLHALPLPPLTHPPASPSHPHPPLSHTATLCHTTPAPPLPPLCFARPWTRTFCA